MHVLLGSHRYYPVPGGTEKVVQTLAEGLVREGHRATVITQLEPGTPPYEMFNGVEVIRLRLRHLGGIRMPVGYLRRLRGLHPDLFHLWGNRIWCADYYFPWARSFRWPQLLTGLGFYQWEVNPRWRDRVYFHRYFPWAVRGFDLYTTSSERERGQLLEWGVPAPRLRPVDLGVPLDEFTNPPDGVASVRDRWHLERPLAAVYAGGFFENKRVDRLIDAIAPVRDRWALVAIGRDIPGSRYDLAACRARAQAAGVELVTPGVVSREDLVRSLFAADAIVLGSMYEGFGLVPVEAMAAGRPFVTFASGALPDVAARGGGIAVRTVEEFTRALVRLDSGSERAQFGAVGRAGAAYYSAEAMVGRFLQVYREIAEGRTLLPAGP